MNKTANEKNGKANTSNPANDELSKVLNEEDKTVKKIDSNHLLIKNSKYKIRENYRDALDLELLEARYSDFLEKYDYIVGDMAYGKLRLRGFYNDDTKKAPIDMRISNLEDYLLEYCSFGCAYFVLENLDPSKKEQNVSKSQSGNKPSSSKSANKPKSRKKPSNKKNQPSKNQPKNPDGSQKTGKRSFTKKNRNAENSVHDKKEQVKEVKNEKGKTRFQIRKKKD